MLVILVYLFLDCVNFAQTSNSVPSYLINTNLSNDDCFSPQFSVCQSLDSHQSILARKLFLKLGKWEGVGRGGENGSFSG